MVIHVSLTNATFLGNWTDEDFAVIALSAFIHDIEKQKDSSIFFDNAVYLYFEYSKIDKKVLDIHPDFNVIGHTIRLAEPTRLLPAG